MPPELVRQIVAESDMTSLLALRRTCRTFYSHATAVLELDRRHLLLHYVPDAALLWYHLVQSRAVVGGLAALSFILRDSTILPLSLDIYVSALHGEHLEQMVDHEHRLRIDDIQTYDDPYNELGPCIDRAVTFQGRNGRFITIHTSISISPLEPIASSPTTALINWVSPYAFACAYPALTLRRRSLGEAPFGPEPLLHSIQRQLRDFGFDIRAEPTAWPDYAHLAPAPRLPGEQSCMREWYVCPCQGRFFGDGGSLVTVFDLFDVDLADLARRRQPPYGHAVAWRLENTHRSCDGTCVFEDPFLPEDLYTVPVAIVGDAFSLRGMSHTNSR